MRVCSICGCGGIDMIVVYSDNGRNQQEGFALAVFVRSGKQSVKSIGDVAKLFKVNRHKVSVLAFVALAFH
jgi:hypothetical protein